MTAPLFRVLVADAEQASRERLRQLLAPEREFLLVGEAADGPGAVTLTRAHRPHVLLLDVSLPGFSGFEVLEQLRGELAPAVIFVTAMAEHAARAFEAEAVDYLLKPFSADRFRLALGRARDLFAKTLQPGAKPLARSPLPDLIALRTGRGRMVMAVAEIQYATADNTCCNVFAAQGKVAFCAHQPVRLGQRRARPITRPQIAWRPAPDPPQRRATVRLPPAAPGIAQASWAVGSGQ
jgi:two-component system LytT family response regulator